MEENNLVQRMKSLLDGSFHGGAWHGPSVLEAVKNITAEEASFKTPTVHTASELIYHLTSWRIFALKRLQRDFEYQIDTEKKNFGSVPKIDKLALETLVMELSLSHDELIKELDTKKDDFLIEIVEGSEYDYYTLIHGIVHHDIYHTGQIMILKKMCAASSVDDKGDEIRSRYYDDGLGDSF
jgi:uncharacterized damage-inducible protein DinB